jgi:CRP-like cAMP-binding protein
VSVTNIADLDVSRIAKSLGTTMSYRPGDAMFREGDAARHMHVVPDGAVEIASHGRVIETIEAGDGLGIVPLIDGRMRSADGIAKTDTEVAVVDAPSFRCAVEDVPNFVWYIMDELAQRLRATNAAL